MRSEQSAKLVRGHADNGQDVPQRSPRHVSPCVDRDWDGPSVGVLHHVMAAVNPFDSETSALERLDYIRSRNDRDSARHKAGSYQNSGHVACQSQFAGCADHIEQRVQCSAQIVEGFFWRSSIANRANTGTEHGGSAPDAVLVLLDGVGHVNDLGHVIEYVT
jgi:hypothetical protein